MDLLFYSLVSSASKATCSLLCNIVVDGETIWYKDTLHEGVAFVDVKCLVSAVCEFCEDVTLIIGIVVIGIDDTNGVFKA